MVRTRFAPSPTGFLHIGGLRTAAYSYALAKHNQGEFLLRIEDTDQEREVPGAVDSLMQTLKTFGLEWDGPPVIQTQRAKSGVYIRTAEKLVSEGHAFYCQCEGRDAKHEGYSTILRDPCRDKGLTSGAIKIKIPDGEIISYHDYVLDKEVSWKSDTVPDSVLLKSESLNQLPTYHLAAVVDDLDSGITHVLRGHDWQPSTPIHLYVYKFMGLSHPEIGHLTDILDPEGGKLSKRKGNVSCEQFLAEGYLPEAILNFVILLGWAPKDNRDLYTLAEFVTNFDSHGFQRANPVFTTVKLDWFNGFYIRQKSDSQLSELVKPFMKNKNLEETKITQILPLVKDRLVKLSDFPALSDFFFVSAGDISYDQTLFTPEAVSSLESAVKVLESTDFNLDSLNAGFKSEIETLGIKTGAYFMNLRVAITGVKFTPPITESILVLGKDETLARLTRAQSLLSKS